LAWVAFAAISSVSGEALLLRPRSGGYATLYLFGFVVVLAHLDSLLPGGTVALDLRELYIFNCNKNFAQFAASVLPAPGRC
jgi:hypothetical protein